MSRTELLIVEQVLRLEGIGLTVMPDFSVPQGGWKDGVHRVRVVTPDGEEFDAAANFRISHFNIRDPSAPHDRSWRVLVSFPL